MPAVLVPLIVVHIAAVLAKLSLFFAIPRLKSVDAVKRFLTRYRPLERISDWILWLTGVGLLYFASWRLLTKAWMLISIGLYILVFLAIRYALVRELQKVSTSQKLYAHDELKRLRTNNWCVALVAIVLLAIIAYLMMTKPG